MKKIFAPLIIIMFAIACTNPGKKNKDMIRLSGEAQGTSFHISYIDTAHRKFDNEIDSILKLLDGSMSTYIESSIISSFNKCDSLNEIDEHLRTVFWKSYAIYHKTEGAFDPTVKPLINFWGFGGDKIMNIESIDSTVVDSLKAIVGLKKINMMDQKTKKVYTDYSNVDFKDSDYCLVKTDPRIQLSFNAIAQGYSVDVIAEFLEQKNIHDYMVEVGGEVRVKGRNSTGDLWKIGIDKPKKDESQYGRPLQAVISLENKAIATSGNYRKYYVKDGVKYSHTIDPKTGYPVQHTLLSATVLADDCMTADGYATAFMVMGHEKAREILEANSELEGYLIYVGEDGEWETFMTKGIESLIKEQN